MNSSTCRPASIILLENYFCARFWKIYKLCVCIIIHFSFPSCWIKQWTTRVSVVRFILFYSLCQMFIYFSFTFILGFLSYSLWYGQKGKFNIFQVFMLETKTIKVKMSNMNYVLNFNWIGLDGKLWDSKREKEDENYFKAIKHSQVIEFSIELWYWNPIQI